MQTDTGSSPLTDCKCVWGYLQRPLPSACVFSFSCGRDRCASVCKCVTARRVVGQDSIIDARLQTGIQSEVIKVEEP